MAWQIDRKVSVGSMLTIAAIIAAVLGSWFAMGGHIKDEQIHHEKSTLMEEYVVKDELVRIENELKYLRSRMDQLADFYDLPAVEE